MAGRQWQGFNWEDPLGLTQQLSEDQRMPLDSAAQ